MKRSILIAIALALVLSAGAAAFAQIKVPALEGRVNDYAHLLSATQARQIDSALMQFELETTTQIVLLTVPSLQGSDIDTFGIRVGEAWKIGQKGKDNGAILLVAPTERKVRIEVGYGLEGSLTDLESAQIIRNIITPAFKQGNYYSGIAGGLDAMMKATAGEFKAPERQRGYDEGRKKAGSTLSFIFGLIVFIILISTRTGRFILFSSMLFGGRGGGRGGFGGGGFSGGGGGFGGGGSSGSW